MKYVLTLAIALIASPALAAPPYACHHDPVCQAKRDGISVGEAKRRDTQGSDSSPRALACMKKYGFTLAEWHAYSVPTSKAEPYRRCRDGRG
jgi:hypothetical protein